MKRGLSVVGADRYAESLVPQCEDVGFVSTAPEKGDLADRWLKLALSVQDAIRTDDDLRVEGF